MSLPPLDLVAATCSGRRDLSVTLATSTPAQSAVLDELHALGRRRRGWLRELHGAVRRAEAQGMPRVAIAAALGLTSGVLRRDLSAATP